MKENVLRSSYDPFDDQIPWVRTADVLPPTNWVLTDYDGWSSIS